MQGNINLGFNTGYSGYDPSDLKEQQPKKATTANNSSHSIKMQDMQASPTKQANTGVCGCCSLEYYQPYFDVTQQHVLGRVIRSLTPWRRDFFQGSEVPADLYGPFWILTTIIILLSLMGNLTTYLNNLHLDKFQFRLQLIRIGTIVVYSFGVGFPLLLGLLLKFFQSKVTPIQTLCLYGYSLSCFIPILVLCVIPISPIQWLLMIYGILNSSLFLILNMNNEIQALTPQKKYLIYGLIACCQIALFLTFKLVFFDTVYHGTQPQVDPVTPDTTPDTTPSDDTNEGGGD